METAPRDQQPIVLLIHGTGAADPNDSGDRWWQRDSDFHRALSEKLGSSASVQPEGLVFHWSGANSERDRRAAGEDLYRLLCRLDDAGQPLHLISHSHGGSVIWHALKKSARAGKRLTCLQSWSCVATPFIQYRAEPPNWFVLVPLLASVAAILMLWPDFVAYRRHVSEIFFDGAIAASITIPLLWALVVAVAITGAVSILGAIVIREKLRQERRTAARASEWYGETWFSLWSPDDEAINGLVHTRNAEVEIIPRLRRVRKGTVRRLLSHMGLPVRLAYNRFLAVAGDAFIWTRVMRRLQGNDWPRTEMTVVTKAPAPECPAWPALYEPVRRELAERADRGAAETLAAVRAAFSQSAATGQNVPDLVESVKKKLSFGELVHTSYFDIPEVLELLVSHLEHHGLKRAFAEQGEPPKDASRAITNWMNEAADGRYAQADDGPPAQYEPHSSGRSSLRALSQGALATLVGFAWLSAVSIHNNAVTPYTAAYQIEVVLNTAPVAYTVSHIRDLIASERSYGLETWLAALVLNGKMDRAVKDWTLLNAGGTPQPESFDDDEWANLIAHTSDFTVFAMLSALLRHDKFEDVETVLKRVFSNQYTYGLLVDHLVQGGFLNSASFLAQRVEDEAAIALAVKGLADAGRIDEAREIVERFEEPCSESASDDYYHWKSTDKIDTDSMWFEIVRNTVKAGNLPLAENLAERPCGADWKALALNDVIVNGKSAPTDKLVDQFVALIEPAELCSEQSYLVIEDYLGGAGYGYTSESWIESFVRAGVLEPAVSLAAACDDWRGLARAWRHDHGGTAVEIAKNHPMIPDAERFKLMVLASEPEEAFQLIVKAEGNGVHEALATDLDWDFYRSINAIYPEAFLQFAANGRSAKLIELLEFYPYRFKNYGDEFLGRLVEIAKVSADPSAVQEAVTEALEYTYQQWEPQSAVLESLTLLAGFKGELGERADASDAADKAVVVGRRLNLYLKELKEVVVRLAEYGFPSQAEELASMVNDGKDWLHPSLAEYGFFPSQAEELASTVNDGKDWSYPRSLGLAGPSPYVVIAAAYASLGATKGYQRVSKNISSYFRFPVDMAPFVSRLLTESRFEDLENHHSLFLLEEEVYALGDDVSALESIEHLFSGTDSFDYSAALAWVQRTQDAKISAGLLMAIFDAAVRERDWAILEEAASLIARRQDGVSYALACGVETENLADVDRYEEEGEKSEILELAERQKLLEIVAPMQTNPSLRARCFSELGLVMIELQRESDAIVEVLSLGHSAALEIADLNAQGERLSRLADAYARLGRYRAARVLCQNCLPEYTLRAYASVLSAHWHHKNGLPIDDPILPVVERVWD